MKRIEAIAAAAPAGVALSLVAAVSGAVPALAQPAGAAGAACTETVSGRVVDIATGEPIAGARLIAGEARATSADDGSYQLYGACPGGRIRAERADYLGADKPVAPRVEFALELRELERLDDIVVEAPMPPASSTGADYTLEGRALERTRGRSLADSLGEVPGVRVLRSGGTSKPIVRGQFGRRLLILFDGVRHESQKWGLDHAPEIDPFAAASLRVIKGAAGVRYGADAIGGVILAEPAPLPEEPGISGEGHLVGVSNGRRGSAAGRVDVAPAAVPGLALRLDGSLTRGAAPRTPDYPLDNTGVWKRSGGASAGYRRDGFDVKAAFRRYWADNGVCLCLATETPDDFFAQIERDRPQNAELFTSEYDIERPRQSVVHDLGLIRTSAPVAGGTLSATYAFQDDHRREFDQVRGNITGPQADFQLTTHAVDGIYQRRGVALSQGVAVDISAGLAGNRQINLYSGLPLLPNYRSWSLGAFAIARGIFASGALEIEAGGRIDALSRDSFLTDSAFARLVADQRIDEDACERDPGVARCSDQYTAPSGSLGLVWRPGSGVSVAGDLSRAVRFPFADELFINGTAPSSPVLALGDPRMGPETTTGASATVTVEREWLSAQASVYGNWIDDYIYFAPRLDENGELAFEVLVRGAFPVFENRPVDAVFYGGEASATVRVHPSLDLSGQAALVRAKNRTDDSFLVFVPADRYRLAARYRLPELGPTRDSYAAAGVTVVTRQDRFDPRADFAPPPDGYALLDAELGTEIPTRGPPLRVALTGANLLDTRYRDYVSLLRYFADEPGIEIALRISTSF